MDTFLRDITRFDPYIPPNSGFCHNLGSWEFFWEFSCLINDPKKDNICMETICYVFSVESM